MSEQMDEAIKNDFDSWAFKQCVENGHTITGVKNNEGVNFKYVNTTTGEEFIFGDDSAVEIT